VAEAEWLACEVPGCGFDFAERYGKDGEGYSECHHTTPLFELRERATRLDEVALVCANCHRIPHRRRPWLKVNQLATLLGGCDCCRQCSSARAG
jgi:5-methylcytosine-specific restriction protein A